MDTADAVVTLLTAFVFYVAIPALFILLILWAIRATKRQQARVDQVMAATERTLGLQEEANGLLRDILETLRRKSSP